MKTGFFREYWAEFDGMLSNQTRDQRRWRVNDEWVSGHEKWGERWETQAIALMQMMLDENIHDLDAAELVIETWGGHPHTCAKRFVLNGKGIFYLPESGTAAGHCTYSFAEVPIQSGHLVRGNNAVQFACSRGESFWGHYIVDNAALRCYYGAAHPAVSGSGRGDFAAQVDVAKSPVAGALTLSLDVPERDHMDVARVDYFGRYLGFDDRGNSQDDGWHGFMQGRAWRNHIGTAVSARDGVTWDTAMLPDQPRPMAVYAEVTLRDGLKYRTAVHEGVSLSPRPYRVEMVKCTALPVPFWSRAERRIEATFVLDVDPAEIEQAVLDVRVWDGGEGTVEHPFLLNGHPYAVTSGKAIHDLIFTRLPVDRAHLHQGENTFTLYSDTEHHGIEVLLPGPCITLKRRNP